MFTYSTLNNSIIVIEENVKKNNYKKAIEKIYLLKKQFIDFFENFYNILIEFENKKVSSEISKILFQVISELYLDLDHLYVDYFRIDEESKKEVKKDSRLSNLLKKLNLSHEIKWFDLANDLAGDIYNFIEFHYEAKGEGPKYCLTLEEIKNKIDLLKNS